MMPRPPLWIVLSALAMLFATQSQTMADIGAQQEGSTIRKASAFIGSTVLSPQGEKLGTIDDLVIDSETGNTMYAALSYGAILGFGGKLVALPWNALTLHPDGKNVVLRGIDKETLAKAPGFDHHNWPQRADPMLRASVLRAHDAAAPEQAETSMLPGETMSATIERIDSEEGSITFRTEGGSNVGLQVPAKLFAGLQVGDAVEVKMFGTTVTAIDKKEEAPPSSASGVRNLRHQSPDDSSKSP